MLHYQSKSKRFLLPALSLLIITSLVGCANRETATLSLSAKQSMTTAKLVVVNAYPELGADIEGSNSTQAMGGGLLFALADMAVIAEQKHSQSQILSPIKNEISSISLLENVKTEISKNLVSQEKFQFSGEEIEEDKVEDYISSIEGNLDSIGLLTPKYYFSEDFASLQTTMGVRFIPTSKSFKTALGVSDAFKGSAAGTMLSHTIKPSTTRSALPKSSALKTEAQDRLSQKLVFANTIEAQKLISEEVHRIRTARKDENSKYWAANNGEAIKKAIADSTVLIAQKLQTTLSVMFPDGINKAQVKKSNNLN